MFIYRIKAQKILASKGVTLIELLVVITIMMTMVALVAPLAINTVNKAEAQSEYLSFCAILRRASTKAFVNGLGVYIQLHKNSIKGYRESLEIKSVDDNSENLLFERNFEYLNFTDTKLKFNKNGLANLTYIDVKQRNRNRTINIIALLEN
jgi:Tfp pilus assembly protein FimT